MKAAKHLNRLWVLVVVGIALYAGCLAITAPASLMAWAIAYSSDHTVVLEAPEGGFWRGRAANIVVGPRVGGAQKFGRVSWAVSPLRLARGELRVDVRAEGIAHGTGTVALGPHSIRLLQARFVLPALSLASFFPALQFAQPGGEVTFQTEDLVFAGNTIAGKAEALWSDASTPFAAVKPLGTYRARAESTQGPAQVEIVTVAGALQINGRGTWSPETGFEFNGVARAVPSEAPRLRELLRLLGREDGNGNHAFRYPVRS